MKVCDVCRYPSGEHARDCPNRIHPLTPDNVKRDNMTDQQTDGHVHHVEGEDPQTAAFRDAINENRLAVEIDQPGDPAQAAAVRTVVIEDGVDSDLDLHVKVLDARGIDPSFDDPVVHLSFVTGEHPSRITVTASMLRRALAEVDAVTAPPGPPLDPPGGPVAAYRTAYLAKALGLGLDEPGSIPSPYQISECIAAGLAAVDAAVRPTVVFGHHDHTEHTGAAMIYDRAGRLVLKWVDRAAHVTATPEVIEGFVDQVNRLRAEVAAWKVKCGRKDTEIEQEVFRRDRAEHQLTEATLERDRLTAWSDELAHRVPESYEGDDGTQEACIDRWIRDLEQVAGPFAVTLRAVPVDRAARNRAILTLFPADPGDVEHLFDAAARLGGE